MKKYAIIIVLLSTVIISFTFNKPTITIYLAGDSTMADKRVTAFPETGWGTRFNNFFDSTVLIVNKAQNGRSTKTFIAEHLWLSIADNLKPGDYVLIQFGHNDEVATKASFTTEDDFVANLSRFVTDTRNKKGVPILITPVARRKFDTTGKVVDTHERYAQLVRDVATAQKVPLIDLNNESMALLQKMGPELSKKLYNHLEPGENPNYPDGKSDDTHFNELGARKMAQMALKELRKVSPELDSRVVKSQWKAN
jgi:lysophospholipase L1-like esterase